MPYVAQASPWRTHKRWDFDPCSGQSIWSSKKGMRAYVLHVGGPSA